MTVVGLAHHNTGKKGTKSKGESEQLGRSETDAHGCGHHPKREQLPRIRCGDPFQQP